MEIKKKDIIWNYVATLFKVASSVMLLPLILKVLPNEEVAIWTVFIALTSFASLLDFGYGPSFTRNVTYVFSGVKTLKRSGFETVNQANCIVDFSLLNGLIKSMKWFYSRMAIILFAVLLTIGTYYIYVITTNYTGDRKEIYFSWIILCLVSSYNLYFQYYDALLQGAGLITKSKQIFIVGQVVYLIMAIILLIFKFGLISIVCAQGFSSLISRWLLYKNFFSDEMMQKLKAYPIKDYKEIFSSISPNAIKIGLTTLGGFMVSKSAIIIGSLFLPLNDIASYGITLQFINLISSLSGLYLATYQPRIVQLRIDKNHNLIKQMYIKSQFVLLLTFLFGALFLFGRGDWFLSIVNSKTHLLPSGLLLFSFLISFLETNHALAGNILLTGNEVPFFKSSLLAGILTLILLVLFLNYFKLGLFSLILAPGIAHLYNNWKWPYEVVKQLRITRKDVLNLLKPN